MAKDDIFDIAIIGGGINGCGIARDAAGRGAKVLLLERGDLASGTSSASTKLIHGGLRYLEHYEFSLVRESLRERERLWKIAPHIIWPLRFILPHQPGLRPRWLIRLGLFLYDHLGGRKLLPATRNLDLHRDPAGRVLKPAFAMAYEYSDCWVDDARLVVLNARDAADKGATIKTHSEVANARRAGPLWIVQTAAGEQYSARTLVNAAGPAVLDLLTRVEGHGRDPDEHIRLVRGSHIIVPRLTEDPRAFFFQNADGRIIFAIPYEDDFTLIGTTDADHKPDDALVASETEIDYLCAAASQYFRAPVLRDAVVWSYAGVRPLVNDGYGKPETASRGYRFDIDVENGGVPLLSVFGGKITTYRHLAESAIAALAPFLPVLTGKGWTADASLPGGDFPHGGAAALAVSLATDYPFLEPRNVSRIIRCYGRCAWQWLDAAQQPEDLGEDFGAGLSAAEVCYLVANEWAQTADDIIWRRNKLGLRLTAAQVKNLEQYLAKL